MDDDLRHLGNDLFCVRVHVFTRRRRHVYHLSGGVYGIDEILIARAHDTVTHLEFPEDSLQQEKIDCDHYNYDEHGRGYRACARPCAAWTRVAQRQRFEVGHQSLGPPRDEDGVEHLVELEDEGQRHAVQDELREVDCVGQPLRPYQVEQDCQARFWNSHRSEDKHLAHQCHRGHAHDFHKTSQIIPLIAVGG
eukprot:4082083-Pyramimonas_sp.AAC.1